MTTSETTTSLGNTNLAQELISAGFRKTPIAEVVSTFVNSFLPNGPSSMSIVEKLKISSQQVNILVPRESVVAANDENFEQVKPEEVRRVA